MIPIIVFTIFNWFLIGIGFRLGSLVVETARRIYFDYKFRGVAAEVPRG